MTSLSRVGDTSELTSKPYGKQFLENGTLRQTPPPTVIWQNGKAQLSSPIGASIGYRLEPDAPWQLYTEPLQAQSLQAKSIRYGWAESLTKNFSAPNISPQEKP